MCPEVFWHLSKFHNIAKKKKKESPFLSYRSYVAALTQTAPSAAGQSNIAAFGDSRTEAGASLLSFSMTHWRMKAPAGFNPVSPANTSVAL